MKINTKEEYDKIPDGTLLKVFLEGDEWNEFITSEDYKNDRPMDTLITEINSVKYTILVYDHNIV